MKDFDRCCFDGQAKAISHRKELVFLLAPLERGQMTKRLPVFLSVQLE